MEVVQSLCNTCVQGVAMEPVYTIRELAQNQPTHVNLELVVEPRHTVRDLS